MLDPEVRRVVESAALAHIATVAPDGSPHSVPIWVGTHGEQVVFFTGADSRKARNLRHDPRVALSMTPTDNPYEPIVVRGRVVAWLDGEEGWEIVDRIAIGYTGQPYGRDLPRIVAVVEPEHQAVGFG